MNPSLSKSVIPFAGCFSSKANDSNESGLVFVGLPDDSQSTYRRGSAKAPQQIRFAYDGNCYNSTTEMGVDLNGLVEDLGDMKSQNDWKSTAQSYRDFAESLFRSGKIPFFVGGDHAVTVPIVESLRALNEPVHVIQLDAHPDLYPEYEGNRFSHACTGSRILEMAHVASLTQIGVRTLNPVQEEIADRYRDRLTIITAREIGGQIQKLGQIPANCPVYMTVDLDALDPAFAPGVAHPAPGGLSVRQVLNFIQNGQWRLVGMDVVEVNPGLDINNQTAILAARILHEAMGYAFGKWIEIK